MLSNHPDPGEPSKRPPRLLACEESIWETKAMSHPECTQPLFLSTLPPHAQTPAPSRAQKNWFLSGSSSVRISQSRSQKLSCCIVNFTQGNKSYLCHRTRASSLPQPWEVGCSPEAPIKARAEGGRNQKLAQPLLPPGAATEQCHCYSSNHHFMPSPVLGA